MSKSDCVLTQEDIQRKESALKTMLVMMKVPENRIGTFTRSNLFWLNRNLAVQNSSHPLFETALSMVRWLIKNKNR